MRVGVRYDSLTERLGAAFNQLPVPVGLSMFGMPVARSMQAAQRLGVFAELSRGAVGAAELASSCGLTESGTTLLLDTLCAAGVVRTVGGRYQLTRRSRKWLDPASPTYVGDFLADTHHYWQWWDGLEALVRDGVSIDLHAKAPEDPYWDSYITGQYQLARLSSASVARAVALDAAARSLLDVAGGHGEHAMALCRRHPKLHATVIDLAGSSRVGRRIVAGAGMAERVSHIDGDVFEADLGGPHDGALCFNIVHHLSPDRARALFARLSTALRPGAPLCVLDLYDRPAGKRPDSASFLGLFFLLTSGADTYSIDEVSQWLGESGFARPKVRRLVQLPGLALLRAERV
jgi:ubiquinone/menaquinone biosynthesis C-methylase UbiE